MVIFFECKTCHVEVEWQLPPATSEPPTCSRCSATIAGDTLERLNRAIADLAVSMAAIRPAFRFEVLLESDDLPAPHGFDAAYELPEDSPPRANGKK